MKFIEHHAVVWNSKEWKRPSGNKPRLLNKLPPKNKKRNEYYVLESGYGHEEWNRNSKLTGGGWSGFFTPAALSFYDQIPKDGQLAILITSQERGGDRLLLGFAVDVSRANEDFRASLDLTPLSKDLWRDDVWESIWQRRKGSSEERHKRKLKEDWKWGGLQHSLRWKCRQADLWWLKTPVILANQVKPTSGSGLTQRMNQSQPIRHSASLVKLLHDAPKSMRSWFLKAEDFANRYVPAKKKDKKKGKKTSKRKATGASSGSDYTQYIQAHVKRVFARHTPLQKDFENYCWHLGFEVDAPGDRIDIILDHKTLGRTFAEVKPTRTTKDTFFAVRLAVGQLLDYEWYDFQEREALAEIPAMLIVLDTEPDETALSLAHSLGIGVAWRKNPRSRAFNLQWPKKSAIRFFRK